MARQYHDIGTGHQRLIGDDAQPGKPYMPHHGLAPHHHCRATIKAFGQVLLHHHAGGHHLVKRCTHAVGPQSLHHFVGRRPRVVGEKHQSAARCPPRIHCSRGTVDGAITYPQAAIQIEDESVVALCKG